MTTKLNFNSERKQLDERVRYKQVALETISYLGKNIYSVDNMAIEFSPKAERAIDALTGITPKQKEIVSTASGNTGLGFLRNYMNIATNIKKQKEVVFIADANEQIVSDVVPLVEDFISYDSFFNLAEMIVDKGQYEVSNVEIASQGTGIMLHLNSLNPTIKKIGNNEEFVADGIYLHWGVASVETGSYFTRLVCMNGATEAIQQKEHRNHSLSADNMSSILGIAKNGRLQADAFDKYTRKALRSMSTQASLRESVGCSMLLAECGIPEELCEQLFSSNEEQDLCLRKGYDKQDFNRVISKHTIWELYNCLTQIATHDIAYLQSDGRRSLILNEAGNLLQKKHDITSYFNLYC